MLPWQRAGVVAGVGEGVAAGVAQHVDVDRKGLLARAPMRLISRFTAAEVKRPPRSVANTKPNREQLAQGRDLVATQRVNRWLAVLEAPNVVIALAYTKRMASNGSECRTWP